MDREVRDGLVFTYKDNYVFVSDAETNEFYGWFPDEDKGEYSKDSETGEVRGTWRCGCREEDGSEVIRFPWERKCWTCLNKRPK